VPRTGTFRYVHRRLTIVVVATLLSLVWPATAAPGQAGYSWLVRAGKSFQRAGEYTVRVGSDESNARFENAIQAYGKPTTCRTTDPTFAVARWPSRGIRMTLATYGGMPEGENGCTSPDLIWVASIRLTDPRWTTSFGLRVGDRTTRLRKLYPRARYASGSKAGGRNDYTLVSVRGPCLGECSPTESRHGVDWPKLTAEVRNGRVIALWLMVGAQGE
jgi:hypothetical protein